MLGVTGGLKCRTLISSTNLANSYHRSDGYFRNTVYVNPSNTWEGVQAALYNELNNMSIQLEHFYFFAKLYQPAEMLKTQTIPMMVCQFLSHTCMADLTHKHWWEKTSLDNFHFLLLFPHLLSLFQFSLSLQSILKNVEQVLIIKSPKNGSSWALGLFLWH